MKFLKYFLVLFLISIVFSCSKKDKFTGVLHNKKVLILGNSITQNGKYVDFIEYYLRKKYPEKKLDIISIGLSSETASGMSEANHPFPRPCVHSRLDNALKSIKPDLVLACYGMNDGIYSNPDVVRFKAYQNGILTLKTKVKAQGSDLILLTPTPFDASAKKDKLSKDGEEHSYKTPYYKYNDVLENYANWLIHLNDKNVQIIDLYGYLNPILIKYKKQHPDATFIPDGVHPNQTGHFLMAKKIIIDLYPELTIGDPQSELELIKTDPLFPLVSARRKVRSNGWLKYVGYDKGEVIKSDNITVTINQVKVLDLEIDKLQNN
jgi:lysophospholipase L1-like esterase